MNVALSKYYEDFVADLIEGGRYGNSSEVVRAGLRALEKSEQAATLDIADLDRKLLAGVRSPARPLADADFDRALATLAQEHEASGKADQFEALKPWLSGDTENISQAEAAARLGVNEGVKVAI